jgi:hypothetical protein
MRKDGGTDDEEARKALHRELFRSPVVDQDKGLKTEEGFSATSCIRQRRNDL